MKLYSDFSWLWPIISPLSEYEQETKEIIKWIFDSSEIEGKRVLDLGCGGGHHDFYFKERFNIVGVDISQSMLQLAQKLNPEVEYEQGDIFNYEPSEKFDVVFLGEAADYIKSWELLKEMFNKIKNWLKPNGVCIAFRNILKEGFIQNETNMSQHYGNGFSITFIENRFIPNESENICESTYIYLIREGKELTVHTDKHIYGVFQSKKWHKTVEDCGFKLKHKTINNIPMIMGFL